jgi:hypothetical protein
MGRQVLPGRLESGGVGGVQLPQVGQGVHRVPLLDEGDRDSLADQLQGLIVELAQKLQDREPLLGGRIGIRAKALC